MNLPELPPDYKWREIDNSVVICSTARLLNRVAYGNETHIIRVWKDNGGCGMWAAHEGVYDTIEDAMPVMAMLAWLGEDTGAKK